MHLLRFVEVSTLTLYISTRMPTIWLSRNLLFAKVPQADAFHVPWRLLDLLLDQHTDWRSPAWRTQFSRVSSAGPSPVNEEDVPPQLLCSF